MGSFAAEHLLLLSQLFNVTPFDFTTLSSSDDDAGLQNALVRLGAKHIRLRGSASATSTTTGTLTVTRGIVSPPSPDRAISSGEATAENMLAWSARAPGPKLSIDDVVREALVSGDSRFITALAPVLVQNIDAVNLPRLRSRLAEAGLDRRLGWLIENVAIAIRSELDKPLDRTWSQKYRRAYTVLELELHASESRADPAALDLLDQQVRSAKTREQLRSEASEPSRRWGVITRIRPADFRHALEMARDD